MEIELQTRERLARLWSETEGAVRAFVYSAVPNFADAADVVQQVALTMTRRFEEYDGRRLFVAWALWLAKSRIADHWRKAGRERVVFSEEVIERMAEALVQQQPERSARQVALEQCIEKLPAKSRQLLDLRYAEAMPVEQVAEAVRSTSGSVRAAASRAAPAGGSSASASLPTTAGNGRLGLRFQRVPGRADLTLTVPSATSLDGPWTSLAASTGGAATVALLPGVPVNEVNNGSTITLQVFDPVPLANPTARRKFLRVLVSRD